MSTMAVANSDNWQSGKTLSQSASFMLDNEIATDVTFTFPNATNNVKAHRFVLMARSHVFYVMLKSTLDKPEKAFEISDIDISIFTEFIKFLYTDEVTLSVEKALHLTSCAEKYEVTDLKAKCTHILQTHIDETNVAMTLDHAVLYNDDALISTCKNIIEGLKSLSCLREYRLTKDTMELILGLEGLAVRELDIFKFCIAWAENECKKRDVTVNGSNKRKMLGPLLRKIPFCSMTQEEFATEVSKKHLLNGQEELQIFRYFCGSDKSNPPFPCKPKKLQSQPQQNSDDDNIRIGQSSGLHSLGIGSGGRGKFREPKNKFVSLKTPNTSEALGRDGCESRLTESMTSGDVLRRERNRNQDRDCYRPKVGMRFGSHAPQDDREAELSAVSKGLEGLHLAATPTGAGHQSMACEREAGHMAGELSYEFKDRRKCGRTPEQKKLPMEQIADSLNVLIVENKRDNEEVFEWVMTNVGDRCREPAFVRALMTSVCTSALSGSLYSIVNLDNAAVIGRSALLIEYLDHTPQLELQALYALQALIHRFYHPKGVLQKFFDLLYDGDIISEYAFIQWQTSTDPAEQAGKEDALKSVLAFFSWLREDDQESWDDF